jgi:hypothetical protein
MPPSDWWLPNDEGCPPIIRSVKDFIRDRTQAPKDQVSEDLREMKGIFSMLTISDSPPGDATSNASNSGNTPNESTMGAPGTLEETTVYTSRSPDYNYSYDPDFIGA